MKYAILTIIAALMVIMSISAASAASTQGPNIRFNNGGSYSTSYSTNWGGYADTSAGSYGSVSAQWVVPKVANTSTGYSSAWVGIGGYNGNSVIQIGTEQDCLSGSTVGSVMRYHGLNNAAALSAKSNNGHNNGGHNSGGSTSSCTPTYDAWWEMYPQNVEQIIHGKTVKAGDHMTASVNDLNNGSWSLTIKNSDENWEFTTIVTPTFTPDTKSAEAILERPALCMGNHCKITSLADFGTIDFSSVQANGGSMSALANDIVMVNNRGQYLADFTNQAITSGIFSMEWLRSS